MDQNTTPSVSPNPTVPNISSTTKTPSSKGKFVVIGIIVFVLVLLIGGGVYLGATGNFSKITSLFVKKTPYEQLRAAIEKTADASTIFIESKGTLKSSITSTESGLTKSDTYRVETTTSTSTNGKVGKIEIRLFGSTSSLSSQNSSLNIGIITSESGDVYLNNASVSGNKWIHYSKAQFDSSRKESTYHVDASLSPIDFMHGSFSKEYGALSYINEKSLVSTVEKTIGDKKYMMYSVEISAPDFIKSMSNNPDVYENEIADYKTILNDAVFNFEYYVEPQSGYVSKLVMSIKGIKQLENDASRQLGLTVKHDANIEADLSRFGLPTNVNVPASSDIVENKVLGISTSEIVPNVTDEIGKKEKSE